MRKALGRLGIVVSALVLSACGRPPTFTGFENYVKTFVEEGTSRGITSFTEDLAVRFGSVPAGKVGLCTMEVQLIFVGVVYPKINPTVLIDKKAWENKSDAQKETLILHELGHCLLGRGHNLHKEPEGQPAEMPVSLMYPNSSYDPFYTEHREYYLDELFQEKEIKHEAVTLD